MTLSDEAMEKARIEDAISYARIVVREADANRCDAPRTEQLARALLALASSERKDAERKDELLRGWVSILDVNTPTKGLCAGKFTLWFVAGSEARYVIALAGNSYDDAAFNSILGLLEATRRELGNAAMKGPTDDK